MFDAIILSDLHLGSPSCQLGRLENFLKKLPPTRELILNGDILESTRTCLSREVWAILLLLREITKKNRIVWVAGNHDWDAGDVSTLIGATFVRRWSVSTGSKKCLCLHGDEWDDFIRVHPVITAVADSIYLYLQKNGRHVSNYLKRNSKLFLHCIEKVRRGSLSLAKAEGFDIVCCGHTHCAQGFPYEGYYNSGCWTEDVCNYLTLECGRIKLCEEKENR